MPFLDPGSALDMPFLYALSWTCHPRQVSLGVLSLEISSSCHVLVGAELANVINEAALEAVRRNGSNITMADVYNAMDRVLQVLHAAKPSLSCADREQGCLFDAAAVYASKLLNSCSTYFAWPGT